MRWVVCLALLLRAASVAADDVDPFDAPHGSNTRGSDLFVEARALLKDGKIDQACERFTESWRIERALGTQLNLASCREHQGKLAEAWELYRGAAEQAKAQHDEVRATFAAERAAALEKMLATVTMNLDEPIAKGTIVTVDGDVVTTQRTIQLRLDPRAVLVAATGPTGVLASTTLALKPGSLATVTVPTLEERPRDVPLTRILVGAVFIGLGAYAIHEEHPVLGGLSISFGTIFALTTRTHRGPVKAPMRVELR